MPWWELPTDELVESLREERAVFWRAWRRYWFNIPSMLMAAILLGMVARIGASILSLTSGPAGVIEGIEWWFVGGSVLLLTPIGIWMTRIRRVEGIVAAQAQANIDGLRAVLARRKGARR
ncbi:hypothetical protein [Variovorax sp. PAMC26660]|uniref:hypothetical protein n=1 Tax=Variovorax sp. PAMC26660 TaxID=2762322 RepID=UPI00164EA44B|nr:hypothetical protein [Variovorax sp. PAMC26660]QNK69210.1 hypothetical protein H7F35_05725 [Variovorax sp. PAMC26660]